jgi:hypothetical protein
LAEQEAPSSTSLGRISIVGFAWSVLATGAQNYGQQQAFGSLRGECAHVLYV